MRRRFKTIATLLTVVTMAVSAFVLTVPEANALTYSGSSYYMSGQYYQNLIAVELTGNPRTDIVNIAASQIGYQEGSSSTQLDGTLVADGSNYTEYGRWYTEYTESSYNHINSQWCNMFVSWCAYLAGISDDVIKCAQYTETSFAQFKSQGVAYSWATVQAGGYTPEAGDIIYFLSSSGASSGRTVNHIGIVTGFSNDVIYTIEGNSSGASFTTDGGACADRSYGIAETYIVYVCRPNYTNVYYTGVHEVNEGVSLNVRDAADSSSSNVIGTFDEGERFNVLEVVNTTWGKIDYYGTTAYVSIKSDYVTAVEDRLGADSNDAITNPTDLVFDTAKMKAWSARGVTDTTVTLENSLEGYVEFATNGSSDPYAYLLFDDTASFYVDDYNYVSIVARTASASGVGGKMYLWSGDQTDPTEDIVEYIDWEADGQWHEYLVDISDQSALTGYFNGIRFDYFDGAAASGDSIQLRSIRFLKSVSVPEVSVSASTVVTGGDLTITYTGLDSYVDGADCLHPYVAVYAEGSYPGNGESVLWNYVSSSGTVDLATGFQGTYAGLDLPVGDYTVWLTYDTSGRDTYISGVHLASESKCASFTVVEASEYVSLETGIVTKETIAVVVSGTTVGVTADEYAFILSADSVTVTDAEGNAVSSSATASTGMKVVADGVTYTIVVEGDLDGDGDSDIADVTLALGSVRGLQTISDVACDAWATISGTSAMNIIAVTALLNTLIGA